jgi:putative Ca2+/H+ antiporter (TMEM165/GDT1 family)
LSKLAAVQTATVLTAFGTVLVAELPDKTMFANVVLSARFKRPFPVWIGAASALTLQVLIAVVAGRLLDLLPDRAVRAGVAVLFGAGAVLLWRSADDVDADVAEVEGELRTTSTATIPAPVLPWWRISATVFGVVFLAEWGDLTQLATASLAARGDALSVFVGATAAMVTVAAVGAAAGQALLRVLPERLLRRVAAAIFAALALFALWEAL